jgi:hypothetical protein
LSYKKWKLAIWLLRSHRSQSLHPASIPDVHDLHDRVLFLDVSIDRKPDNLAQRGDTILRDSPTMKSEPMLRPSVCDVSARLPMRSTIAPSLKGVIESSGLVSR